MTESNQSGLITGASDESENKRAVIQNNTFSIFKAPIKTNSTPVPFGAVNIYDVYQVITSDKYKAVTLKLRSLTNKVSKTAIKERALDYVTFSGLFTKKANRYLKQHSNLFCIDLDHLGNAETLAELGGQIRSIFEPVLMFVSPSGDGLKVVFVIDIEQGTHDQYFTAFKNFFSDDLLFDIPEGIDLKCKDVSRATFLCYDSGCFYSENPTVLDANFINDYGSNQAEATTPKQQPVVSEYVKDETTILEEIERLKKWTEEKYPFEEGNRNKHVTELCGAFNRVGISEETALETLLQFEESGFPESEIRATVRSTYRNKAFHNIAPFGSDPGQDFKAAGQEPTPSFPIDGFPELIQGFISECSRIYGTHPDLWAAAFFAATSTAIGQSVVLKTKYENSPLFWMAVVGPSGIGKTEPYNFSFKPLHDIDYIAFDIHKNEMRQFVASQSNKATAANTEKPKPCKQFIVIDSTPEALVTAMGAQPRGITLLRDELHGWFNDFGRYHNSGEQQNMLSTWSQQPFRTNRKSGDNEFIKQPFVNVFGGIQPGLLTEMAKDNRALNGFLQRFCFVFPDEIKAPVYISNEISEERKAEYRDYINRLLAMPEYRQEIKLSFEASQLYEEFYNKNAALNNSNKQADYLNEVNSKLNIIALRAAILFHFSQWACSGKDKRNISGNTMQAAIKLAEYFRLTARKVYTIFNQSGTDRKAVAKYLTTLGNSQNAIAEVLKVSQQYINKIIK